MFECGAADDSALFDLMCDWATAHDHSTFELSPFRPGLVARMAAIADGVTQRQSGNWHILDWPATVAALLKARAANGPLPDGRVVVAIKGGVNLALSICGDAAECAETRDPADVSVDPLTATRLLLGPLSPSRVMPLPRRAALLDAWCPLPLAWPTQDGV